MVNIPEPYIIRYPQIVAVADSAGERVELIEFFDCTGGAMWAQHHYAQSPLVCSVEECRPYHAVHAATGGIRPCP